MVHYRLSVSQLSMCKNLTSKVSGQPKDDAEDRIGRRYD
jgi:hypothetical protein